MSMSTHVSAYRDMDGEFKRMLEIHQYCREQKVSLPKEVEKYFGTWAGEDERTIREEMLKININKIVREVSSNGSSGYEIDVADLPKEVKTLRFENSW